MKALRISLFLGFTSLILLNCKKGENDPFISFSSRKTRITNEWNIKEWNLNYKNYNSNAIYPISTMTQEIKDNLFIRITTGSWGNSTEEGTINSSIWTIDKNNTWNKTVSFTSTLNSVTTTRTIKNNGTWYFLNNKDEYKNKERILFNTTQSIETTTESYSNGTVNNSEIVTSYSDDEESKVYEINQLKSKETVLKREQSYKNVTQSENNLTTNSEYILLTVK